MHDPNFLQDLLVLFALGTFTVVLFHRINLPPVLGFLLTGLLCGPYGFKLVENIAEVDALAELGVVLLLFTIGIEFSFEKLKKLRRFLLIGGSLQVLGTIAATAALSMLFGLPGSTAIFLGMLVSLSSTVLVVRLLQHRNEMNGGHGTTTVGILVFQDLCIVPMVLAVPFLGGTELDLTKILLLTGKSVGFVVIAVSFARYFVPWLLDHVANTRKREAFVLSIMLLCLGTGYATSQVGLSLALGAFLAGLVISESKYSHQAFSDILPFREVFNFLVFVSIGMMFDARTLLTEPLLIGGCLLLLILVKAAITTGIAFGFGYSLRIAILTGFTLAQASEFSFVLAKVGLAEKVLNPAYNQVFLAVAILSMAVTPLVCAIGVRLAGLLEKGLPARWIGGRRNTPQDDTGELENHVVIVGFGVGGRTLATVLKDIATPHVVIELDPDLVKNGQLAKVPVFYGDASSQSVLEHAGIAKARLIAITTIDARSAARTASLARRINPDIQVLARARMVDEVDMLVKAGAHEVVPEELTGSVEMLTRVLGTLHVPAPIVEDYIEKLEKEWTASCPACYPSASGKSDSEEGK
ncbi:MAG: cation:proton antiporter [Candidatus Melainabacteria bacterium]|nr:cation:proton antiporter [Candidatus Melainabacteria bacterium]